MDSKDMYGGMLKRLDKVNLRSHERVIAEKQMRRAAGIVDAILGMFDKGAEPKARPISIKH